MKLNSLLVPSDFSRKSETAIRYACEIASYSGAEIHFLHVIDPPYDFPSRTDEFIQAKKEEAAENLESLINGLHATDEYRHIRMKGAVKTGTPGTVLLDEARTGNYDMIIVGLGGEHDLKKALYGSITNNLLLDSPIPVFAMAKQVDYKPLNRLVFATALRSDDIQPIRQMKELSIELGVRLQIVHIVEIKGMRREKYRKFLKKLRAKLNDPHIDIEFFEGATFLEGIVSYIGNDKHTLLVTTRYKKRFLEWLITRSSVRVLAQIAAVPLMMIPNDE
jgi:nucleotide-binding universal stress UspA family protein